MSTAPESPRYPDKPAHSDHRLGSGMIVGIVVACIIAAVAATTAVIFAGPEPTTPPATVDLGPKPKASGSTTVLPSSAPQPNGIQGFTEASILLPQRPPLTDLPLEAFEFDNGLPLEVPPGWSIIKEADDGVVVGHDDYPAIVVILVGTVKQRSIEKVLAADIKANSKELDNFELNGDPELRELDSATFPEAALVGYTGDLSTQQGTLSLLGVYIELFNPETQMSAFFDFSAANEEAFEACADDVDLMIDSML